MVLLSAGRSSVLTSVMFWFDRIPVREETQVPFQIRCLPVHVRLAER